MKLIAVWIVDLFWYVDGEREVGLDQVVQTDTDAVDIGGANVLPLVCLRRVDGKVVGMVVIEAAWRIIDEEGVVERAKDDGDIVDRILVSLDIANIDVIKSNISMADLLFMQVHDAFYELLCDVQVAVWLEVLML